MALLTELEDKISSLIDGVDKENFIYDFMREMGIPKSTVTKLKKEQRQQTWLRYREISGQTRTYITDKQAKMYLLSLQTLNRLWIQSKAIHRESSWLRILINFLL